MRERGMVSAEFAVIAPLGLAFAMLMLWIVSLGHTQVQLTDAAREAARVVARGDSVDHATELARSHGLDDAEVEVVERDGLVTVTVTAASGLPWFGGFAQKELRGTAVAASESS